MADMEGREIPVNPLPAECTDVGNTGAITRIGEGEIGGKARGLVEAAEILRTRVDPGAFPEFTVGIPRFVVIATDMFDIFMKENRLHDLALSETRDRHLACAFQRGRLPQPLLDFLRGVIEREPGPLAIRSSSLLEDSLNEPFAGVYATKMVPNNQFSAEARLRTVTEGIKYVYASTFFRDAKSYRRAAARSSEEEKMAVIIQEVVGLRHGNRFYPTISGVGRSRNFYSLGHARPEDGVVSLALGLGKTIVDGGRAWTYCPAYPKVKPPFASTKELLTQTQTRFWCVNMGKPPIYDPTQETEYLCEGDLQHAEEDDVLHVLASTYDPQSDRIMTGVRSAGPRVLNFAPLLELNVLPLNTLVGDILRTCEEAYERPVEIEFAVNLAGAETRGARFGFLQVRPMIVSEEQVDVGEEELRENNVILASEQVLGNGRVDTIRDIVYVRPDNFSAKNSWLVAAELGDMNRVLLERERSYLLVAIGRLGTSDPWLGIPVKWGQVSGARAVVEVCTNEMNVDMSQGSHFFHNVMNLRILYFSADMTGRYPLKWDWLERQREAGGGQFVRHVVLDEPLGIKVDGKRGRGLIRHEGPGAVGN